MRRTNCNMATKVAPKKVTKTATKTSAKVDDKAAAASEKAKLIQSLSEKPIAMFREMAGLRKKMDNIFFDLADFIVTAREENSLSDDDCRLVLKTAIAEAYDVQGGVDGIAKNPTLNANVSKIMRLVNPEFKDKRAEKEFEARKSAGTLTTEVALDLARGASVTEVKAPSAGKGKNKAGQKSTGAIEDEDTLKTQLSAVISKALKGKFDLDTVGEVFAALIAEYEEDANDKKGEGEEETED